MTADGALKRRNAQRWGIWAEFLAAWWLRLKGYRIVFSGLDGGRGTGMGQVDLIARRGHVLAFVEVKARASLDQALYAVHPAQRARIVRAAQGFVARHPHLAQCQIRFDAVLLAPGRWPHHIPNAWQA